MVNGTKTVPYLHRDVRGERIVGTVVAGLVPALVTHEESVSKLGTHKNIVARSCVDAWKGTLTPTLSQTEREPEESPLPRFGREGQGEGVCHDYHGLPVFETVSKGCPCVVADSVTVFRNEAVRVRYHKHPLVFVAPASRG